MTIVVMTVATIVTLGMIGTPGTTATVRTVTGMTGTATIVTGTTAATAGNAPGRLLAVLKLMIVAPSGLHLLRGMMIEGLQGTMIGGVAMMTEEALILTMTAAGTMSTDAGTIAVVTRGKIVSMIGRRGTLTGITHGHAED
ncbi:hypothetical protein BD311DRAFT_10355 [Dichomitus squalens]|uniref:Uncharacterized protein n=1 Tax=Dichomitus squalens TaxID=114155 RepID=A0A4Q9N601_9APHY|nr:hypothetical protein BD311DRAFT_10355 [Dichomitus squalens]